MGYRSNVAYLIMFDEQEVYNQFKVQYKLDSKYELCREDEAHENDDAPKLTFDDEKARVQFIANEVKWYPDYPDVDCHHALLDLAREYNDKYNCCSWAFVRVGEESDDIQYEWGGEGDAYMYLYPITTIQWDI